MRSTADRTRRAATLGSDVPRGEFPVRVHSVFRAALNLRPPDGDLLTLLSAEADDLPRGVRLASAEDFSSLGLAAGDGGVFTVDEIVLERSAGCGRFRVDCASARRLVAQPARPLRGDGERWRTGVALLEALQERAATDLRIAPLLAGARPSGAMGERLTQDVLDLGRGVRAGCLDAMRGAATRLVGLGPGLTPAGDDFLCGFFAAGHCRCAARPARSRLLTSFAEAVRELLGQTTDISAALLSGALAGRVFRPLAALAEACSGAPGSNLNGALLRLAAVGHSSGLDAATGFFYGAKIWGASAVRRGARAPTGKFFKTRTAGLRPRRVAEAVAERQLGAADPPPSA
jgi:hypothetical protein